MKERAFLLLGISLLVVICSMALFACGQSDVIAELTIVEDEQQPVQLSEAEIEDLADVLYAVMRRVVQSRVSNLSQATEGKVRSIAVDISHTIRDLALTERQYLALMSVLNRYDKAENVDVGNLVSNLYLDLAAALGDEKSAEFAYEVLLYYCHYQSQKYQQRYDENGYAFLLADAERYQHKYDVLSACLAPEELAAGLNVYLIVNAAATLAQNATANDFLTNEEILMLIKAQNCTSIALETDVWYELLTLINDFVSDKYYKKIVEQATDNGDLAMLGAQMNDVIALVRALQQTITSQDVALIQEGAPIAGVLLALLGDEQLRAIDAALSKEWHYAKYNELANKQYGERYLDFVSDTKTVTLDELLEERQNVEDPTSLLIGYLAGKCYALALEVQP